MKSSRSNTNFSTVQRFVLSAGGIGFIPFAPGTWGSALAFPIFYLINFFLAPAQFLLFAGLFVIASGLYLQRIHRTLTLRDDGWIVLDELAAVLLAIGLLPSTDWEWMVALFFTFRFFDIIKFWPASYFDQKIKNGWGILLDDLAAALQTVAVLWLVKIFLLPS